MRRSILLILLATATTMLYAQSNVTDRLMNEGRRLHSDEEYAAALNILNKIDTRTLSSSEQQEIEFLRASATFNTDHMEGRALLLQYLADYPETSHRDVASALIAESYYYSHNFELANKWFKEADFKRLDINERERAELHYALTLQECGEVEMARNRLATLCITGKRYSEEAQFQLATMQYHNDELQQAYDNFKKVEMSDKYYLEVPYYIAGIYVKQGKYEQAQQMAEAFIADHKGGPQGVAMSQMLGAAFFGQKMYADAIAPLETYLEGTKADKQQRIAKYQLAMSYFETAQANDARALFEQCIDGNDIIAQNSLLHLGIIYLQDDNAASARMAFEQASNMDCDNKIREEALYNYALCIHQTRYSPFAESVKVFERFLNEYPQSPHADQVNKYLVEVYMNTRNYDVALQSIEKIAVPSPIIYEAKQKVLYRLGVQEYINGNMDKAINYFNRSIALSQYNKETYSDALYWRGEAYYNKNDYATAAKNYKSVLALGEKNNKSKATYGLAYTYFQSGNMSNAENEFMRFVNIAENEDAELKSDAYNRIADCYFYKRDYAKADEYYRKAGNTHSANADYALYRSALAQGLKKDYKGKVNTLNELVSKYPGSDYTRQGYYEMARAYIEMEENTNAINALEQIINRYPQSDLARRAAVEQAMLHNSNGNQAKAINAYKNIITLYPNSEEAQIAAQDLKNLYVETGDIDEYTRFVAKAKGLKAIESNEIDTLTFIAAEKIYGRGNTKEAKEKFNSYIEKFPNGAFAIDCHYYLGVINYNSKNYTEAAKHLEEVIALPDNKYSEEAMAYCSEINYNNGEWGKAKELYQKLIDKSNNEERRAACRINLLRCVHNMHDDNATIEAANAILQNAPTPDREREALYYRAKALLNTNNKNAEKDLATLAKDTRTIQGAEAKYLLAQLMFDQKREKECENIVMDYIETSTPHTYWLARSFVLLADLYASQGRNLEAKQYLLSLQSNYEGDDDIKSLIENRLEGLSTEN